MTIYVARVICLLVSGAWLMATAMADQVPHGLKRHWFETSNRPVTDGDVTYFKIIDKLCSNQPYPDGRGESDCKNGLVRSNLVGEVDVPIGYTSEYKFDLWMQPNLKYRGWDNELAYASTHTMHDSKLRLASWEGENVHNFIYVLKADAVAGITFLGHVCQSPRDFGHWVRFYMRVRWSLNDDGHITVTCNGSIIYQRIRLATAVNPRCYITDGCQPGMTVDPSMIHFLIGPTMTGHGSNYHKIGLSSPFVGIQDNGIEVRMRDFNLNIFHE